MSTDTPDDSAENLPEEPLSLVEWYAEEISRILKGSLLGKRFPTPGRRAGFAEAVAEWMIGKGALGQEVLETPIDFTMQLIKWTYPLYQQTVPSQSPAAIAHDLDQTQALYNSCRRAVVQAFERDEEMKSNVKSDALRQEMATKTARWLLGRRDARQIAAPGAFAVHTLRNVFKAYGRERIAEGPLETLLEDVAEGRSILSLYSSPSAATVPARGSGGRGE